MNNLNSTHTRKLILECPAWCVAKIIIVFTPIYCSNKSMYLIKLTFFMPSINFVIYNNNIDKPIAAFNEISGFE